MPSKRLRCPIQEAERSVSPSPKTNVSITLKLDQESPNSLQIHQDSSPRAPESTSGSPDETLLSTDSCCKNKTIEVLPKREELFPDLIKQIKEPRRKSQSDFQATDPTARVSIPTSLKRDEIPFPGEAC